MGGDFAPEATVLGVIEASKKVSKDTTLVLYGCEKDIRRILSENKAQLDNIEIVNTSEVIEMNDSPTQAFVKKSDSSITVGFSDLEKGKIDGFASAGSTGAMMVGCMYSVKQIEGIIRPAISTVLPTIDGRKILLLDVGLNIDCKPEVLYQYGIIGSIYGKKVLNIPNPRVALLNIGEEPEKGNALVKATHQLMHETEKFRFVGNVEPKYMYTENLADIYVCDGFIGNLVIKLSEGFYSIFKNCKGPDNGHFVQGLNYEREGGTAVLGVNSTVIIGHGCSSPLAIQNMILQTEKTIASRLTETLKETFANEKS